MGCLPPTEEERNPGPKSPSSRMSLPYPEPGGLCLLLTSLAQTLPSLGFCLGSQLLKALICLRKAESGQQGIYLAKQLLRMHYLIYPSPWEVSTKRYYHHHSTDGETEASRGKVAAQGHWQVPQTRVKPVSVYYKSQYGALTQQTRGFRHQGPQESDQKCK